VSNLANRDDELKTDDEVTWRLLRDSLSFQFKLLLDWLRDIALSPVALMLTLAGLVAHPKQPGVYFYALMKAGRRSDSWINLFSMDSAVAEENHERSVDDVLGALEQVLRERYHQGGITARAKGRVDLAIGGLRKALGRGGPKQPAEDDL